MDTTGYVAKVQEGEETVASASRSHDPSVPSALVPSTPLAQVRDLDQKLRKEVLQASVYEAVGKLLRLLDQVHTIEVMEALAFLGRLSTCFRTNQILISIQRADTSHVAGYQRWKKLGRQVRKVASGIFIWARVLGRGEDDRGNKVEILPGYRPSAVFAAEDLEYIETNSPRSLWSKLPDDVEPVYRAVRASGEATGVQVVEKHLLDAERMTDGTTIMVKKSLRSRNRLGILIHEWAHTVGHVGPNRGDKPRGQRELEAEASAFNVIRHLGIEQAGSRDYLCTWRAIPDDLIVSFDAINKIVKRIVTVIEQA